MKEFEDIKKHYRFSIEEAKLLREIEPMMIEHSNDFIEEFYDYIWGFGDTAKFLKNQQIVDRHKAKIKEWFIMLFSGSYGLEYFNYLYKIGEIHVKIGLPTHFVNAAFTFVRSYIRQSIRYSDLDPAVIERLIVATEKIIDINLDVLTSSYREEELGKFLSMSSLEKTVLSGLKKINSYVNLFLAASLALVAFFAIGLFLYDTYLLISGSIAIEEGVLTVLGSLLVLWAAIELIHEEIKHIQGKSFALGAFIMLAMAALIRKVLVYSLSSEKSSELLIIGVVIVFLAVAYWIIGIKAKANHNHLG